MKTVFKNKTFRYILICFFSIFILWYVFIGVTGKTIGAVIPILIQVILLILIITYNKYARIGIIIWTAFLIVGSCLTLLAFLFDGDNNFIKGSSKITDMHNIVFDIFQLAVSIFILYFTIRTIKVERPIIEDGSILSNPQNSDNAL